MGKTCPANFQIYMEDKNTSRCLETIYSQYDLETMDAKNN